jgi:hypothetical protein
MPRQRKGTGDAADRRLDQAEELYELAKATLERAFAREQEALALKAKWQWHIDQLEKAGLIKEVTSPLTRVSVN